MVVGAGGREGAVSLCAVFDTHDTLSLSPLSCLVPGPRRELRGQLVSGNFQSCLHLVITPVPGQRATTRVRASARGRDFFFFFCKSSLLRINQRHHCLGTRLWYTPPAAVRNPLLRERNRKGGGQAYVGVVQGPTRVRGLLLFCESSFFLRKYSLLRINQRHHSLRFLRK